MKKKIYSQSKEHKLLNTLCTCNFRINFQLTVKAQKSKRSLTFLIFH